MRGKLARCLFPGACLAALMPSGLAAAHPKDPTRIRAAILTLGGKTGDKPVLPGIHVVADDLREAASLLADDGVELVVLRIDVDWASLQEAFAIADVIDHELDPAFRVVIWIRHATGPGAAIAMAGDEIVTTPDAEFGRFWTWSGPCTPDPRRFEHVLSDFEDLTARNGRPLPLARAMLLLDSCSYTRHAPQHVEWFGSSQGQVLLSDGEAGLLTLDAASAVECGLSLAAVDSIDEFASALAINEIEWVGLELDGESWPICEAERHLRDRARSVTACEAELERLYELLSHVGDDERLESRAKAADLIRQMSAVMHREPSTRLLLGFTTIESFEQWVKAKLGEYEPSSTP